MNASWLSARRLVARGGPVAGLRLGLQPLPRTPRSLVLAIGLTLAACEPPAPDAPDANPLAAPPIDTTRVASIETTDAWDYRQQAEADLDGDAVTDTLVLTSDVTVIAGGRPIWEDGHRWAAYVASAGDRTMLYSAFVPNGFVEAAILDGDDGVRGVLILERSPGQLRTLEVGYAGPGRARLASAAYYQLDRWLPGFATLDDVVTP